MELLKRVVSFFVSRDTIQPKSDEGAAPTDSRPDILVIENTSSSQYEKKRRFPRFSVEGKGVRSKMIFSERAELRNVSIGGACFITSVALRPHKRVLIKIGSERIDEPLKGMSIWTNRNKTVQDSGGERSSYSIGIEFRDVTSNALIQLKDFMRASGVPEEKSLGDHQPSPLRYAIIRNEKAVINYPETCRVKKLSLCGMLMETDRELPVEQKYPMALFLPKEDEPIKFHGRIASLIPLTDKKRLLYDTGVEFLDLTESDRSRLEGFITTLSKKS
ncbi:MAG: PilZ domain-containing protein [Nitrospirota bacterium]